MAPIIRQYVDDATGPLLKQIEEQRARLEAIEAARGEARRSVESLVVEMGADLRRFEEAMNEARAAADKRLGAVEASADRTRETLSNTAAKAAEAAQKALQSMVTDAVNEGIERAVSSEAIAPAVTRAVEIAIAALPAPKDGAPGKDGRDGVDAVDALQDKDGNLILTFADGRTKNVGRVVGRDGRDGLNGERGAPGFSLADFDTEFRHEDKVLVLKFDGGDTLETHEIFLPYVRDCGVWKDGAEYLQGDGVTWGGSFWTAQKDTTAKPDGSSDWRLAVKKGRDGKDFAGPQVKAPAKVKV